MWYSDNTLSLLCLILLWAEGQKYFGFYSHFLPGFHQLWKYTSGSHILNICISKVDSVSCDPGQSLSLSPHCWADGRHSVLLYFKWGWGTHFLLQSFLDTDGQFKKYICFIFDYLVICVSLHVGFCGNGKGIVATATMASANQNAYVAASEWGIRSHCWLPPKIVTIHGHFTVCIKMKDCEIPSNGFFSSITVSISRHSTWLHKTGQENKLTPTGLLQSQNSL